MYPSLFNRCYMCHGEHTFFFFNMVFLSMCEHEIACLHMCVSALITGGSEQTPTWLIVTAACSNDRVPGSSAWHSHLLQKPRGPFVWVGIHIHGRCSGSVVVANLHRLYILFFAVSL